MTEKSDDYGPVTLEVLRRWEQIIEYVRDGLEPEFHIKQIKNYILLKYDEAAAKSTPFDSPIWKDLEDANFWYEIKLASEFRQAIEHRQNIISVAENAANRFFSIADDLTKFAVRTAIIAHGSIIIAALAALSQTNQEYLQYALKAVISASFAGFALAGLGLMGLLYSINYTGVKFSEVVFHQKTYEGILQIYEEIQDRKFLQRMPDYLLYASFGALVLEGVVAVCMLYELGPFAAP